eukprot:135822_1
MASIYKVLTIFTIAFLSNVCFSADTPKTGNDPIVLTPHNPQHHNSWFTDFKHNLRHDMALTTALYTITLIFIGLAIYFTYKCKCYKCCNNNGYSRTGIKYAATGCDSDADFDAEKQPINQDL